MSGRVLFDAFDVSLNKKGVNRALTSILPRLADVYGSSLIACTTEVGVARVAELAPQVRIVRLPSRIPKSVYEQVFLPLIARLHRCNCIYLFREAGPLWGPPYVLHVTEDPEIRWLRSPPQTGRERLRRIYHRAVFAKALNRASVAAGCTPAISSALERKFSMSIETIPLGVEISRCSPDRRSRINEATLLHLCSEDPRDNTRLVLETLDMVQRQVSCRLAIVGSVSDAVRVELEHDIVSRGHIQWMGRVDDNVLLSLYSMSTLLLQPSSDEGFGLVPLEAMAYGTPVVALDTPAVRDVVGEAGTLVAEPSAILLAEAVASLLSNERFWREKHDASLVRSLMYGWDITADLIATHINAVLTTKYK